MKRKTEVVIKVVAATEGEKVGVLHIWADNVKEIQSVEGVTAVLLFGNLPVSVHIDARYDAQEVAAELMELLSSKVSASLYNADSDSEAK